MRSRKVLGFIAALAFLPAVGFAEGFDEFDPGDEFEPIEDEFYATQVVFDRIAERFPCEKIATKSGERKLVNLAKKITRATSVYERQLGDISEELDLPNSDELNDLVDSYIESCKFEDDDGGDSPE